MQDTLTLDDLTLEQINYYMSTMYHLVGTGKTSKFDTSLLNPKPNFRECLRAASLVKVCAARPLLSPLNAVTHMVTMGYDVEYKEKQAVFSMGDSSVSCSISGIFVNPEPLKKLNQVVAPFYESYVAVSNFIGTYAHMKAGKAVVCDPGQAGSLYLGIKEMMPNFVAGMAYICDIVTEVIQKSGLHGDDEIKNLSLSGMAFNHAVYIGVCRITTKLRDELMEALNSLNISRPLIEITTEKRDEKIFRAYKFKCYDPKFPAMIAAQPFKTVTRSATETQAYETLRRVREFRGTDRGEKAGNPRQAYAPVYSSPDIAEMSYMATEFDRVPLPSRLIVFVDAKNSSTKILHFLDYLQRRDWDGQILMNSNPALLNLCRPVSENSGTLKYQDAKYFIKVADVETVVGLATDGHFKMRKEKENWHVNKEIFDANAALGFDGLFDSLDVLLIDFRVINPHVQNNVSSLIHSNKTLTLTRLTSLRRYGIPFIVNVPASTHALSEGTVTNVRLHNGVVMYTWGVKFVGEKWWYDLKKDEDLARFYYTMVIANLMRNHATMSSARLSFYLRKMDIIPPIVRLSKLGKVKRGMVNYVNAEIDMMEVALQSVVPDDEKVSEGQPQRSRSAAPHKIPEEEPVQETTWDPNADMGNDEI